MVSSGRPKKYNTDEEIKQARRENAKRAYIKKHNINIEEYNTHKEELKQKQKIKFIKQWIKSHLNDDTTDKIYQVINIIDNPQSKN